ncbi:DUF4232 domain-containing protein [Streptacidiphilus sp. 4-A2]|nr:DUF4232 domain-containing protein [Streptacidiphilus sp. 4-A2]
MKTQLRKAAGLGAAVAVSAALIAVGAGSANAQTVRAPQRCATSALTASLHADGNQAGVGNFGENLALTNTSHQTCTVYGYPGLALQNGKHSVLPIQVVWGSTYFAADPGATPSPSSPASPPGPTSPGTLPTASSQ